MRSRPARCGSTRATPPRGPAGRPRPGRASRRPPRKGRVASVPTGESLSARERSDIERAAVRAGSATGLVFTVCLLDAGGESRNLARRLHAQLTDSPRAVLVLVDPAARDLEIVTGTIAHR